MKIGILTYHRSHNYGALLQALALRYQLTKMGNEVYFIDYWPKYHRQMYELFSFSYALQCGKKKFLKYIMNFISHYKKRKERIQSFEKFIVQYIIPHCLPYAHHEHFDIIVYGSDQIWRKQPGLSNQFNPIYFADNILQADRHISYAASMGGVQLNDNDYEFLRQRMNKFSYISVRESGLQNVLRKIDFNADVVLDPTLLLTPNEWEQILPIQRFLPQKYVLFYRLLEGSFDEKALVDFSRKLNCELIILDSAVREEREQVISTANPLAFLSLLKYAEFVFTSSYHGLVFSLIFKKQFYASFIANKDRAKSLLENIGLNDRLLNVSEHEIPLKSDIEYESVDKKIAKLRLHSLDYLHRAL